MQLLSMFTMARKALQFIVISLIAVNVLSYEPFVELSDYQQRVLCVDYGFHKVYYIKGLYECINGKLVGQSCFFGYEEVIDPWICNNVARLYEPEEKFQQAAQKVCAYHRAIPGKKYALYHDYTVLHCKDERGGNSVYNRGDCLYKDGFRSHVDASFDWAFSIDPQNMPSDKEMCLQYGLNFGINSGSFIESEEIDLRCPYGMIGSKCIERWPDRTVNYYFDAWTACDTFKEYVRRVMREFSRKTCLKFHEIANFDRPAANYKNYVKIVETDSNANHGWQIRQRCSSDIGMRGGQQILEATFYCVFQKFHQLVGLEDVMPIFSRAEFNNPNSVRLSAYDVSRIRSIYEC